MRECKYLVADDSEHTGMSGKSVCARRTSLFAPSSGEPVVLGALWDVVWKETRLARSGLKIIAKDGSEEIFKRSRE